MSFGRSIGLASGILSAAFVAACSGASSNPGFGPGGDDGGGAGDTGAPVNSNGDSGSINNNPPPNLPTDGGAPDAATIDAGEIVTIYANTDDRLYSMDPKTKAVTLLGTFAGLSSSGSSTPTVTDVAVNAAGDVYVNTESDVYKATLPPTNGTVQLTSVASIAATSGQRFYALAFAPAGALGTAETLVGGDGNGELWSIDVSTGAISDLGSFGNDPSIPGNILALSGDLVFYNDSAGKPTGLATIRSCKPATSSGKSPSCSKNSDFLAGVDMAAMATAYKSGTPAASLNAGIYGGSSTSTGSGIGYGEVFGLGAWDMSVYGFTRNMSASSGGTAVPPQLVLIDTSSGKGMAQPGGFSFTNGWSGAGVTTKVQVVVAPPPPPPK